MKQTFLLVGVSGNATLGIKSQATACRIEKRRTASRAITSTRARLVLLSATRGDEIKTRQRFNQQLCVDDEYHRHGALSEPMLAASAQPSGKNCTTGKAGEKNPEMSSGSTPHPMTKATTEPRGQNKNLTTN